MIPGTPTTLVVEDDRDNRELMVRLLRRVGHHVDSAATIAEAMNKIGQAAPKVILLDLHLPDGTGADVLGHIRAGKLPIAVGVVTGAGEPDALAALDALTPDAVFIKPVNLQALFKWVESAHAGPVSA